MSDKINLNSVTLEKLPHLWLRHPLTNVTHVGGWVSTAGPGTARIDG